MDTLFYGFLFLMLTSCSCFTREPTRKKTVVLAVFVLKNRFSFLLVLVLDPERKQDCGRPGRICFPVLVLVLDLKRKQDCGSQPVPRSRSRFGSETKAGLWVPRSRSRSRFGSEIKTGLWVPNPFPVPVERAEI